MTGYHLQLQGFLIAHGHFCPAGWFHTDMDDGPKTYQKRQPWKQQHDLKQNPGEPFLICSVEYQASYQCQEICNSSYDHISGFWGQAPV